VILRRAGGGIDAHAIKPPARRFPANPAAPEPGISLVSAIICGSYPSLLIVTVISALRFAWTTQGVTQAVGMSSPEISAVAPAGVVAMEIFSVVPRVTDAQPIHGNTIAAAKSNLIIGCPPIEPSRNHRVKARARSRPRRGIVNWPRRADRKLATHASRAVTFAAHPWHSRSSRFAAPPARATHEELCPSH
jgi:hypothetical protein